jgi:hypothetical protein
MKIPMEEIYDSETVLEVNGGLEGCGITISRAYDVLN